MITLAVPLDIAEQGVCGQVDPELFFPEAGASTAIPKRLCLSCPVLVECRDWALAHNVRYGVWGGLSERERTRLRRQAADAA